MLRGFGRRESHIQLCLPQSGIEIICGKKRFWKGTQNSAQGDDEGLHGLFAAQSSHKILSLALRAGWKLHFIENPLPGFHRADLGFRIGPVEPPGNSLSRGTLAECAHLHGIAQFHRGTSAG